jgi:hypothetical protein
MEPGSFHLLGRTLVGRYQLEELIGRGGMGLVFRALDRRLDRAVAVKVLSLPPGSEHLEADLRARLRREAAAAARIPPHPNVVQVHDYGTDPDLRADFIAMELLPGTDLKTVLRERSPTLAEALEILRSVARGIAAGHRAGIVHRDVKPSNILVSGEGAARMIKILDFGIAKALEHLEDDDLTRTGHVPHSPAYASPEQLRRETDVSPASDVFQLGLLGYELLAGTRPYDRADQDRIRAREELGAPTQGRWLEVPQDVRAAIERALANEPSRRFPDAGEFLQAIEPADPAGTIALDALPGTAPAPPGESRSLGGSLPRRPRVPLALGRREAALLGAGALVLLLAFFALGRSDGPEDAAPALPDPEGETATRDLFRDLQVAAAENLLRFSPVEGGEAAHEVTRVVEQLNQSLAEGDLENHVLHYAANVQFYGTRTSRRQIERSREDLIESYPARSITLGRTSITFPEPGRAEVLLDKRWDFRGDQSSWTASARHELVLERQDDRWEVVSEREIELFDQRLD